MRLIEILNVHEGETHRQHPPDRLELPDPERRYFTSIETIGEIEVGPLKGYRVRKWRTFFGPHPTVALRRAYVRLSQDLAPESEGV